MVADPVHDAERAIEVCSEQLPDVVLMDIVFKGGGQSGIHATRRIKEVSPSTKVVIMTATTTTACSWRRSRPAHRGSSARTRPRRSYCRLPRRPRTARC